MRSNPSRSFSLLAALLLLVLVVPSAGAMQVSPSTPAQTGTVVQGMLQLPGGAPAVDAYVALLPYVNGAPDYNGARYSFLENSNYTGAFAFSGVMSGTYILELTPPYGRAELETITTPSFTVSGAARTSDRGTFTFAAAQRRIVGSVKLPNGQGAPRADINAYTAQAPHVSRYDFTNLTDGSSANDTFDIAVAPGEWNVYPSPPYRATWMYTDTIRTASIPLTTPVTRTLDFNVALTTGTIEGRVLTPDGTALVTTTASYNSSAYVYVYNVNGSGSRFEPIDADGTFEIPVVDGQYNVQFYFYDQYSSYTAPANLTAVVKGDAAKLGDGNGDVQTASKSATIRGTVTSDGARGVSDVIVYANSQNNDYESTTTDASGAYTLALRPGVWTVDVYVDSSRGFIYNSQPATIEVSASADVRRDFALLASDYQIKGSTVELADGLSRPTKGAHGWAYARNAAGEYLAWDYVQDESFTLNVPRGTYDVGVELAPGSRYAQQQPAQLTLSRAAAGYSGAQAATQERAPFEVTVTVGDDLSPVAATAVPVEVTLTPNDATLEGELLDVSGNAVQNVTGQVFATPADGQTDAWQVATINPDGTYSLSLLSGSWHLGYYLSGNSDLYSSSSREPITLDVPAGTTTRDINLTALDGVLRGQLVELIDGSEQGVPNQEIWVSGSRYDTFATTDANGNFELFVPLKDGVGLTTYELVPQLNCPTEEYCYINPQPLAVTAQPRFPTTPALRGAYQFDISKITATRCSGCNVTVSVDLVNAGADEEDATVTVKAPSGSGLASYEADLKLFQRKGIVAKGSSVNLEVTAKLGSYYDRASRPYTINSVSLGRAAADTSDSIGLELKPIPGYPEPLTDTFDADEGWSAVLSDGSSIQIPPGAVPPSAGDGQEITVIVQPTSALPIGAIYEEGNPYGYTISLQTTDRDGKPKPITEQLMLPAKLTMRYNEAVLRQFSTWESHLLPALRVGDDWTIADNFTANPLQNEFTVQTTALGTWALMQRTQTCTGCVYLPIISRR